MPTAITYCRFIGLFGGQGVIVETIINFSYILLTLRRRDRTEEKLNPNPALPIQIERSPLFNGQCLMFNVRCRIYVLW